MDHHDIHAAFSEIEIAKSRIIGGDYFEARIKLHEIQSRHPAFDGIAGMIAVTEILQSVSYRFLGCGVDHYMVLQVSPSATDVVIQSQFNKFTKLLEPIIEKNFPGAASALKFIQDAFQVLSNTERHTLFSRERATSLQSYGSHYFQEIKPSDVELNPGDKNSDIGNEYTAQAAKGTAPHIPSDKNVAGPANVTSFLSSIPVPSQFSIRSHQEYHSFNDGRKAEVFAVGQVWATYDDEGMPRNYAQIVNISPTRIYITLIKPAQASKHEKSWCEAGLPIVCGLFNVERKQATAVELASFSHVVSWQLDGEQLEIYPRKGEIWAIYKKWDPAGWLSNPAARKSCRLQIVEIIGGYCDNEPDMHVVALSKVEGFKNLYRRCTHDGTMLIPSTNWFIFSHRIPAYTFAGGEMDGISRGMFELDGLAVPDLVDLFQTQGSELGSSPSQVEDEGDNYKRLANVLVSGQTWAVYDGRDSMPRLYVVVINVVSAEKICVQVLEPHPISILEIDCVSENLPFGCGSFRMSETTEILSLSRFSHMIECEKVNGASLYNIYPRKGEIWAMYMSRNSEGKPIDLLSCQCRIVEILLDLTEDSGLVVGSLEKVLGSASLFQRQSSNGFQFVRTVPRREMLSFSHQIPASSVPELELYGIPTWHLEPKALPPNCKLDF
ncbi:hypothetical protein Tsubulata_039494 [Turnera subulata]|uniref:J domain-containing protein n=1 Tax=Turnera subulata TaxID=218843 RepID=A0A9Q0EYJ1_9ROSI|nr:hypothetical protein Tsubulata_039494 [Turnera subulata]